MGENTGIVPPELGLPNSNGLVAPARLPPMGAHFPPMYVPPPNLGELPPPLSMLNHPMGVGSGMGAGFLQQSGLGYGMPPPVQQFDYDAQDRGSGYFPAQYPANIPGFPGSMTSFPPMGLPGMGGYAAGLLPAGYLGYEGSMLPPYATNDVSNVYVDANAEVGESQGKKKRRNKNKKGIEPPTVESLINVPLPQTVPTTTSEDGLSSNNDHVENVVTDDRTYPVTDIECSTLNENKNEVVDEQESNTCSPVDIDVESCRSHSVVDNFPKSFQDDSSSIPVAELTQENVATKEYHFAWDSVQVDDLSISSVHTSDLSGFDDSEEEDDRKNRLLEVEQDLEQTGMMTEEASSHNDAFDVGEARLGKLY